jgi:hypothetical protein
MRHPACGDGQAALLGHPVLGVDSCLDIGPPLVHRDVAHDALDDPGDQVWSSTCRRTAPRPRPVGTVRQEGGIDRSPPTPRSSCASDIAVLVVAGARDDRACRAAIGRPTRRRLVAEGSSSFGESPRFSRARHHCARHGSRRLSRTGGASAPSRLAQLRFTDVDGNPPPEVRNCGTVGERTSRRSELVNHARAPLRPTPHPWSLRDVRHGDPRQGRRRRHQRPPVLPASGSAPV